MGIGDSAPAGSWLGDGEGSPEAAGTDEVEGRTEGTAEEVDAVGKAAEGEAAAVWAGPEEAPGVWTGVEPPSLEQDASNKAARRNATVGLPTFFISLSSDLAVCPLSIPRTLVMILPYKEA